MYCEDAMSKETKRMNKIAVTFCEKNNFVKIIGQLKNLNPSVVKSHAKLYTKKNNEHFLTYFVANNTILDILPKTMIFNYHSKTKTFYTVNALIMLLAIENNYIDKDAKFNDITSEIKDKLKSKKLNWDNYADKIMVVNKNGDLNISSINFKKKVFFDRVSNKNNNN